MESAYSFMITDTHRPSNLIIHLGKYRRQYTVNFINVHFASYHALYSLHILFLSVHKLIITVYGLKLDMKQFAKSKTGLKNVKR